MKIGGGSNLPPGGSGFRHDDGVPQKCKNGHEWTASMYFELGGWFYDRDADAFCPVCDEEALEAE